MVILYIMVNEMSVINYYMRTSKGIRSTARYFGLKPSYVGSIINKYI